MCLGGAGDGAKGPCTGPHVGTHHMTRQREANYKRIYEQGGEKTYFCF